MRASAGATAYKGCEGSINLVAIARVQNLDLQPECVSNSVDIFHGFLGNLNISRIYEWANASGLWQQLTQEFQPLTSELKKLMPVALPPGRDRLATRPCLTGSGLKLNQISAAVAALTAKAKLAGFWVDKQESTNKNYVVSAEPEPTPEEWDEKYVRPN